MLFIYLSSPFTLAYAELALCQFNQTWQLSDFSSGTFICFYVINNVIIQANFSIYSLTERSSPLPFHHNILESQNGMERWES